uniref:Sulfur reduction protein DsrE n=1 Tax=Hydrogenovibrio crunogenus (strain DSM 25203 / XCL-2) TaxID=317025 RepID=Q31DM8_HYDCU
MINKKTTLLFLSWMMSMLISLNVLAMQEPPLPETFAEHKVVLQISDPNPFKQTLVLNVAGNLIKHYGASNIDLEIVAFGPGLRLMMDGNTNQQRIKSLMSIGVRFSGCANTLNNFSKILGSKPELIDGVTIVPAGAARILQLNAAGYQILKP